MRAGLSIPLGIVPARGASKRLPGKNMLLYQHAPLFVWAARALIDSRKVERVVVSTDDLAVADLAAKYGLESVIRRGHAATYASTGVDVCLDTLNRPEFCSSDAVACVYGTAFRLNARTVATACSSFRSRGVPALIGVSRPPYNPYQVLRIDPGGQAQPLFPDLIISPPRMEVPLRVSNGTLYVARAETLRELKTFYVPGFATFDVPDDEVTDINVPEDLVRYGLA